MATYAEQIAALRGTRTATIKELLANRSFARLLWAQVVGSLGDWIGYSAMSVLAIRLAEPGAAAFALAGVWVARLLPGILFGAIAGALADRYSRKRLMIISDLVCCALYAVMPFTPNLWVLFVLTFVIEIMELLWGPARDASLPNIVPRRQLGNANALGLLSAYGPLPIGGAAFAILVGIAEGIGDVAPFFSSYPESLALWFDSLTFVFSATMLSRISFPAPTARSDGPIGLGRVIGDIVDGVRFLRGSTFAYAMTLGIVIAFSAVGAVLGVGPIFVQETLGTGSAGWGVMQTTVGLGMAVGMLTAARWRWRGEKDVFFTWGLLAAAASLAVLAAMPELTSAALVSVVLGLFCGGTWVLGYVLLQENVEDEFRGRTFAALTVLSRLGLFLSLTTFPVLVGIVGAGHGVDLAGFRLDLSGSRVALWTSGGIVVLAGVLTRRGLHRHRIRRPIGLQLVTRLRRPPATGLFVVFEGVEGSGKGTQITRAEEHLRGQGLDVLTTREPGGTPLGESLRQVLLDESTGHIQARAEAMLFAAARAQLVSSVIRPALAAGKVVLCDRYIDSSLAYQGWARGLGEGDVLNLNAWATQGLFPDLVILLHLEPEAGLRRAIAAGADRMEREGIEFHAKVSEAYLNIAEDHPERFVVVDVGEASEEEVGAKVTVAIDRILAERAADESEG